MSTEKEETNLPPSYTESLRPHLTSASSASQGQSLLDTLTLTRAATIRTAIHTHILPALSSRAALGLPHSVLALLPSGTFIHPRTSSPPLLISQADIPLPAPPEKNDFSFDAYGLEGKKPGEDVQVLGFADAETPTVVRLTGEVNSTGFWRQAAVVEELRVQLSGVLNEGREGVRLPEVRQEENKKKKRGVFGRKGKGVERREEEVEGEGKVGVRVGVEEICLRTTSEFGLYDTLSRVCVVVRVEARC